MQNQFYFLFKPEGSLGMKISVTPEVCMALADMFRNEGPVKYNTDNNTFSTGPEPIGEGEPVQP
jgi:hypothetical protein